MTEIQNLEVIVINSQAVLKEVSALPQQTEASLHRALAAAHNALQALEALAAYQCASVYIEKARAA
jgi:copper homeostasis protein CutC